MQAKVNWPQAIADQLACGIDKARGKRSDQQIADRTAELGHALSRPAVSEYRRGKRKTMSVTDLLVLAAALDVPPVALLFPDLPDGTTDLLPTVSGVASLDALLWFTGERATVPGVADDGQPGAYKRRQDYEWLDNEYLVPLPAGRRIAIVQVSRSLAAAYSELARLNEPDEVTAFLDSLEDRPALERHEKQRHEERRRVAATIMRLQSELANMGGVVERQQDNG